VCRDLSVLLTEVFGLPSVSVGSLAKVTSKGLYTEFTSTLPRPKIEAAFLTSPGASLG
jgi:hypothetical protein